MGVCVCVWGGGVTCNLKLDIVHVRGQLYWTSSTLHCHTVIRVGGGEEVNCNIKLNTMPRAWTCGHPKK